MTFGDLRLRSLVSLISLVVVSLFLILYLSFQYFWVYEKRISEVTELQSEEQDRVMSILDIKGSEMTATLSDYAAWSEMIEFIKNPTDEFKQESMNVHALTSNHLDSFFMLTPDYQLSWGLRYDYDTEKVTSYDELLPTIKMILKRFDQNVQKQTVESVYRFVVIHDTPYLLALSRVCQSDGSDCQYGYMVFVKKLNQSFLDEIHLTTGLNIDISTIRKNEVQSLTEVENVSYVVKKCALTGSVLFKVHHNVKLPRFLYWDDILALGIFVLVMFSINMLMVSRIVKPVVEANNALKAFKKSGKLPDSDSFFSGEMKQFGETIYKLVQDLEDSRSKLQWQSEHDSLTQLANRYCLETEFFAILENTQYRSIVFCIADIDHFKAYNDNYGHIKGDNALIQVSSCLEELSFPQAEKTIVARFGGEEFCIVVASQSELDKDLIGNIITQSIFKLKIPHEYSLTCPYLTLSVGGILIDQLNSDDYLKYFKQADKNLYQAKNEGRNQAITSVFS